LQCILRWDDMILRYGPVYTDFNHKRNEQKNILANILHVTFIENSVSTLSVSTFSIQIIPRGL
jgi:hypothetical protein